MGSVPAKKFLLEVLLGVFRRMAYCRGGQPVRDQNYLTYCVITKSHILYCVTAKSRIIHFGTHEHHPISSSLTHIPLLS